MNTAARQPISREAIWDAFTAYCNDAAWSMSPEAFDLAKESIEELESFHVQMFDHWYVRNVYRFQKMRETDRRASRYIIRRFIGDLTGGRVKL